MLFAVRRFQPNQGFAGKARSVKMFYCTDPLFCESRILIISRSVKMREQQTDVATSLTSRKMEQNGKGNFPSQKLTSFLEKNQTLDILILFKFYTKALFENL